MKGQFVTITLVYKKGNGILHLNHQKKYYLIQNGIRFDKAREFNYM